MIFLHPGQHLVQAAWLRRSCSSSASSFPKNGSGAHAQVADQRAVRHGALHRRQQPQGQGRQAELRQANLGKGGQPHQRLLPRSARCHAPAPRESVSAAPAQRPVQLPQRFVLQGQGRPSASAMAAGAHAARVQLRARALAAPSHSRSPGTAHRRPAAPHAPTGPPVPGSSGAHSSALKGRGSSYTPGPHVRFPGDTPPQTPGRSAGRVRQAEHPLPLPEQALSPLPGSAAGGTF